MSYAEPEFGQRARHVGTVVCRRVEDFGERTTNRVKALDDTGCQRRRQDVRVTRNHVDCNGEDIVSGPLSSTLRDESWERGSREHQPEAEPKPCQSLLHSPSILPTQVLLAARASRSP